MPSLLPKKADSETMMLAQEGTASKHSPKKNLVHSLTGLRLWAALAVFFSHLYHFNYFNIPDPSIVKVIGGLGHLGVSVFYVLSGFVLYINHGPSYLQTSQLKIKSFYWARFARVYPVYALTTLLAIPPEILSLHKTDFVQALLLNLGLLQCLSPIACGKLNDVGWSVGVEAVFYLLFPFFLMQFNSNFKILGTWLTILSLCILLPLAFPESFYGTHRFPGTRLLEFFTGLSIAHAYWKGWLQLPKMLHIPILNRIVVFSLCSLLILQPVLLPGNLARYDYLAYIPATSGLIILLALWERHQLPIASFASSWAVFGGEISYSFYLIHNLLLRYLEHGLNRLFHLNIQTANTQLQIMLALGMLALSILAATWLYQHIEKPWRDRLRSWVK